jgi:glycogen debranching enzyme
VVSSNAGQVLWSGIAGEDRARRVAARLLADDMFTGWGIRTLSERSKGYNPIGYHLGTVWPHDNALIGAGLVRYGLAAEARRIFDGICDAAAQFEHQRLPELWTGFSRQRYGTPIRYPVACHPQAWAAGSLPYLLTHLLGLEPHAFDRGLRVVRPVLPSLARRLAVRFRVGRATATLRFTPGARGDKTAVDITDVQGDLDIQVED